MSERRPPESTIAVDGVEAAIEALFQETGTVRTIKNLAGGLSGAGVYVVDVPLSRTAAGNAIDGLHILKIDARTRWNEGLDSEGARHSAALSAAAASGEISVPRLVAQGASSDRHFLLYEKAGDLDLVRTASALSVSDLEFAAPDFGARILMGLNSEVQVRGNTSAAETLTDWLGYRLEPAEAPLLWERLNEVFPDNAEFALFGKRLLCNPMVLAEESYAAKSLASAGTSFGGLMHGDFHLNNIILERALPGHLPNESYIDFALSRPAPLFYDQAYLECSILASAFTGTSTEALLDELDAAAGDGRSVPSPTNATPSVERFGYVIANVRSNAERWLNSRVSNRQELARTQYDLARVAAAINWAAKPVSHELAQLFLLFAAHSADSLIGRDDPAFYRQRTQRAAAPVKRASEAQEKALQAFAADVGFLEGADSTLILLRGQGPLPEGAEQLGLVPWAAVLDTDRSSEEVGLYATAGGALKERQAVHLARAGGVLPEAAPRSTVWALAGPDPAQSRLAWLKEWPRLVRDLVADVKRVTSPRPLCVIAIPPSETDWAWAKIGEALLEVLEERDHMVAVTPRPSHVPELLASEMMIHTISERALVDWVGKYLTRSATPGGYGLPTTAGVVPIGVEVLRALEQDLDVLHTDRLFEDIREGARETEFLRGGQPAWADLHADLDVRRASEEELRAAILRTPERSPSSLVELRHRPGAGGSTVARRVAWDLHTEVPVVVARRVRASTAERLARLNDLSSLRPVCIVDGAVASLQVAQGLVDELLKRDARVTVVYVGRTSFSSGGTRGASSNGAAKRALYVEDPMSDREAQNFAATFSSLARDSPARVREIQRLATSSTLARSRNPFVFTLLAVGEEVYGLGEFVAAHFEPAALESRRALGYLALVTRYAQTGLDWTLVAHLLRRSVGSNDPGPAALVGESAARLVAVAESGYRLLHPLIAEEILRPENSELSGVDLTRTSLQLLEAAGDVLGVESDAFAVLVDQLFIQRPLGEDGAQRERFSELITDVATPASALQIFDALVAASPRTAHYYHHRGRFRAYVLQRDFELAEEDLERAIELSPGDSTHWHALGVVRRRMLRAGFEVDETPQPPEPPTLDRFVNRHRRLFERAAEAFAESRRLAPDDEYGYITQIQMSVDILEYGARISQSGTPQRVLSGSGNGAAWLREQIVTAQDLLGALDDRDIALMESGAERASSYRLSVDERLAHAFGNTEALIAVWEAEADDGGADVNLSRALNTAYLRSAEGQWGQIPTARLRRMRDAADGNLVQRWDERDVRTWLQAARRLPEFSLTEALMRAEEWVAHSGTPDAYLWTYALHVVALLGVGAPDVTHAEYYREGCFQVSARRAGRKNSRLWLSERPIWCPLVHAADQGGWDPAAEFLKSTEGLARSSGFVESVRSPTVGRVRLDFGLSAFFVPGRSFFSEDANARITCHVGFSLEGLRAWRVERA